MKTKMTLLSLCLLAAVSTGAAAQSTQKGFGTALPFTRIDRNPRSSALAGAGAASLHNAGTFSAFHGAAVLPFMEGKADVALGYQLWEPTNNVDKTHNIQGGAALRFGSFGVALGGAFQSGVPFGNVRPSDQMVSLGLSYAIGKRFSLGVNARWAGQQLAPNVRFDAFSMDIAALGKITRDLSATVGVSTLGTTVTAADGTPYGQPTCVYLGLAWAHTFAASHRLELMLDGDYNFDGSGAGVFGAEYAFRQMLFVRVGYRLASASCVIPSHLGLGLGVCFSGFRVELSYLTASKMLANSVNIGLGYRF